MTPLIDRLTNLILRDDAVFFVGGWPLEQQVAAALAADIGYGQPDGSLTAVSRHYELRHSRTELIRSLKSNLATLERAPQPLLVPLVNTLAPHSKLVSTRIDRALDLALAQAAKPFRPIRDDDDVPFFSEELIMLVKLFGDTEQADHLRLTQRDRESFLGQLSTVRDVVRAFFATKTLVFVGYDVADPGFEQLFLRISDSDQHRFRRTAYVLGAGSVSPELTTYWQQQGVELVPEPLEPFLQALATAVSAQLASDEPIPLYNPLAPLAQPEKPDQPYKALDSFGWQDAAIFNGRSDPIQRLGRRILAHPLTVLYGESGSGKTSLLQAGVLPWLAQHHTLLAVAQPVARQPLADTLRAALVATAAATDLAPAGDDDLPTLLDRWARECNAPIVVAIDQFEQLLENSSEAERETAVSLLHQLHTNPNLNLKLVFSLREDYLGRLESLGSRFPNLLDVTFRLERLGSDAARDAITQPAAAFGVQWEPRLVTDLLRDLGDSSGINPPQLQVVCAELYDHARQQAEATGQPLIQISYDDFAALGRTANILGSYIDKSVNGLAEAERPLARLLLGALVSSSGVKQRLPLAELLRVTGVDEITAVSIMQRLVQKQLVRRYRQDRLVAYELTHDYLVLRILAWLGDSFWKQQQVREILRQGIDEWQRRQRLLAPGDVELAAAQSAIHATFTSDELTLLFASAVGYGEETAVWSAYLTLAQQAATLTQLLDHADGGVRSAAAAAIAPHVNEAIGAKLVTLALNDVTAGAAAVATLAAVDCPPAIAKLVTAAEGGNGQAVAAVAAVRDKRPLTLPTSLRRPILRLVGWQRWQRHKQEIFNATVRGAISGFLGFGLGLGLVLTFGLATIRPDTLAATIQLLGAALFFGGIFGLLAPTLGAFVHTLLRRLLDGRRWLIAGVVAVVTAVCQSATFLFFSNSLGSPDRLNLLLAGCLIGGLTGFAASAPLRWPSPGQLLLTVLLCLLAFWSVSTVGWAFFVGLGWLLLLGGMTGLGFFAALNPLPKWQRK